MALCLAPAVEEGCSASRMEQGISSQSRWLVGEIAVAAVPGGLACWLGSLPGSARVQKAGVQARQPMPNLQECSVKRECTAWEK